MGRLARKRALRLGQMRHCSAPKAKQSQLVCARNAEVAVDAGCSLSAAIAELDVLPRAQEQERGVGPDERTASACTDAISSFQDSATLHACILE